MEIDAQTGQVTLPSGFVCGADLTRTQFASGALNDAARVWRPQTPWFYHPFIDGQIEEYPLEWTFCFYRDVLVRISFRVDLYFDAKSRTDWNHFSLDTENQMQQIHARLLKQCLGAPHQKTRAELFHAEHLPLNEALNYRFVWGEVWCGHDSRSGITSAVVTYQANDKWAHEDYHRIKRSNIN